MDDRQRQIREGAGQLESRLNEEFIEFLQKWSMPLLVCMALGAVGYLGWTKFKQGRADKVNQAFQEYEAAASTASPSPESLKSIAEQYEGVKSVSHLARLEAADAFMRAVRLGVKPGGEIMPDGSIAKPEDTLTEQDSVFNLNQAQTLYQKVADDTAGKPGQELLRLSALYGLAAVAESRKLPDQAKGYYEQVVSLTEGGSFAAHAKVAKDRIAGLGTLDLASTVYTKSQLPELPPLPETPKPEPVVSPPAPDAPKPDAPKTDDPAPKPADAPPVEPAPQPAPK